MTVGKQNDLHTVMITVDVGQHTLLHCVHNGPWVGQRTAGWSRKFGKTTGIEIAGEMIVEESDLEDSKARWWLINCEIR